MNGMLLFKDVTKYLYRCRQLAKSGPFIDEITLWYYIIYIMRLFVNH